MGSVAEVRAEQLLPLIQENQRYLLYICIGLGIACLLLAIFAIHSRVSLNRLTKKIDSFLGEKTDEGTSVLTLLNEYIGETRRVGAKYNALEKRTSSLEIRIIGCMQKLGVVRYNPFNDTGGDLSYVIAVLDDTNSGFILNGIYNRDGSYTYAKEIEAGISTKHKLSAEELEALQLAVNAQTFEKPQRRKVQKPQS